MLVVYSISVLQLTKNSYKQAGKLSFNDSAKNRKNMDDICVVSPTYLGVDSSRPSDTYASVT